MKKLFHYLSVVALAALTLTGCDDVPMPYNQPNIKPDEPGADVTPTGNGTAADPYNVAAVLQRIEALTGDTTEVLYVKGIVKEIRQIETEQYGNANYYITDDGSNQVYIFQSYYLGNRRFTADDKLAAGDTVVVCGRFYNYNGNTPETTGRGSSYIYSLNGKTSGGNQPSGVAKGDGTEASPYNVAAVLQLYANNSYDSNKEVYVTGTVSKVGSIDTGQYGNATYYISDDGTSSNDFEIYRGYYYNGDKFTSSDQLKEGDVVVVCGKLTKYNTTNEMAQGSRLISINGKTSGGDTPKSNVGLNATFSAGQDNFTINNVSMGEGATYVWKHDDTNGYMKASAYVNRKNIPCVSQLVSPAFSLEGLTTATLTFQHAMRFFGTAADELEVLASTDGKNWTKLTVSAYSDGKNWTFVDATCDLSAFAGQKQVYIAFQYTSTADHAATWEVKNVVVK